MELAYTIGNQDAYDRLFEDRPDEPHFKIGIIPEQGYDGGWVWRSRGKAEQFIRDRSDWPWTPKVYLIELPTSWSVDVSAEPHPSDGVHRLINDARLFQLR
jgi:hypothetical protein